MGWTFRDSISAGVRDFLFAKTLSERPSGLPSLLQWTPGVFPWIKRPRLGGDHSLSYNVEAEDRVQLIPYSPSVPSCHVTGKTLPLSALLDTLKMGL